jgi:uncharacterized membrane protein
VSSRRQRGGHHAGTDDRPARPLALTVLGLALVTLVALVLLWPGSLDGIGGTPIRAVDGTVTSAVKEPCAQSTCARIAVRLDDGPEQGSTQQLTFVVGAPDPKLRLGDSVRMSRVQTNGQVVYSFADIERGTPLAILALVFLVCVVLVGRWRGIAAVLGLAFSFGLLAVFALPALLTGGSPLLVALAAGSAIVLVTVPLAHGWNTRSATAIVGTMAGLVLCAGLAVAALSFARLTGLSSEEPFILQSLGSKATITGLILCGAIIGSLGALNDVTVTQASAVREIALAAPDLPARRLFAAGMRVGRDHIASTIYTLALAYAGSGLPTLLLLTVSKQPLLNVLTGDAIATELLRSLVGSIALVAAVPLTTALAAAFLARAPRLGQSDPHDELDRPEREQARRLG